MRVLSVTLIALFTLFFKVVRCGDNLHNNYWAKRHNPRFAPSEDKAVNRTHLEKRIEGARFTFYDVGLGSCGSTNVPSDFIVALNTQQYDGGKHCYQTITITVNGKTAQAVIVDECMGCGYGALDFSRSLFDYFGSEGLGVLTGSWNFGGVPAPASSSTPIPTPTPTSTWKPLPSSTSVLKSTSTSTSASTTSSVSSSQAYSTSSTSSSVATATSTPLIPPSEVGNIAELFLIFVQIGSISTSGRALN